MDGPLVLLVDDDRDVLESTAELLNDLGYATMHARSGASALRMMASGAAVPAVMLVDLEMPGMDGEELCRQCSIDPRLQKIPRVFVSGSKEPEGLLARSGAVAFMSKPVDDKRLLELLGRVLKPALPT